MKTIRNAQAKSALTEQPSRGNCKVSTGGVWVGKCKPLSRVPGVSTAHKSQLVTHNHNQESPYLSPSIDNYPKIYSVHPCVINNNNIIKNNNNNDVINTTG